MSKKVRSRILASIDSQDTNVVFDMRNLIHEDETKFDDFFNEDEKIINEYESKAVDDLRHGLVSHIDVALYVADLRNQIDSRLPQGSAIPSVEWLRLQFMPKVPALASASQYTGRFPLKHRIQSRQFNAFHIDAHYAAALQKYLKEFAVLHRDFYVLLSVDDKNHIPVGEPGFPITTIYRSKKAVTHVNIPNIAANHDTASKCKFSPSVAIVIEVPEDVSGDFYNGQVTVFSNPQTPCDIMQKFAKF